MTRPLLPSFTSLHVFHDKAYTPCVLLAPTDAEDAVDVAAILAQAKQNMCSLRDLPSQAQWLTKLLSAETAEWTLCVIDLFQASEMDLQGGTAFLPSATKVQAYVVYVVNAGQREICFKLTRNTIQKLVELYKNEFLPPGDAYNSTWASTVELLHHKFTIAVNEFMFRTDFSALKNLKRDGSGVLIGDQEQAAREALSDLFVPIISLRPVDTPSQVQDEGWPIDQETAPHLETCSAASPASTHGAIMDYGRTFSAHAALQNSLNSDGELGHFAQLLCPSPIPDLTENMVNGSYLYQDTLIETRKSLDKYKNEFRAATIQRMEARSPYGTL
ncbi:hypothetical protein N7523_005681 [Penicillium sp. IBT 18751x]|nr:hypothetical protein N7523_005681 [Penicillium sp. IBT 18751x]